jgi:hypothetical protein
VANPVLTCATATDAGYPSNFVADPFLYIQVRLFLWLSTARFGIVLLCRRCTDVLRNCWVHTSDSKLTV